MDQPPNNMERPSEYNYLQNFDIWGHIVSLSFERALNSLLKVNKMFQTLVEAQYVKLFEESKQILVNIYRAAYSHDYTVLRWNHHTRSQTVEINKIEEILLGKYRKRYAPSPELPIFKFAFDCGRWDCASQIFQLLTPHDKGIVLTSEISLNEIFTRHLLEKKTHFNVDTILMVSRRKIAHLCETVNQFPDELRRYYVESFLERLKFDVCYEEYKKRYLTS